MITDNEIKMLQIFSPVAKKLLQGLLHKDPKKRLGNGKNGIKNIKDHEFFREINWDALLKKEIEPPFVPLCENEIDLANIDKNFTKENAVETPVKDDSILQKAQFENFTYVEKNNPLKATINQTK